MKKGIIVYATREGQTEKVSRKILEHLQNFDFDVTLHNAKEPFEGDITDYDFLLFGASLHTGGIEKELRRFVLENQMDIDQKPKALFVVSLSNATKDEEMRKKWMDDAYESVHKQLPIDFDRIEMIAGALKYTQYSFPIKWIMKMMAKKAGGDTDTSKDYEYTDWQQVENFSRELANTFEPSSARQ